MMILVFILLVSGAVICAAVALDVLLQIWDEKREEREMHSAKIRSAQTLLYASLAKRHAERMMPQDNVFELNVVALPQKPIGGRHRLSAA